MPGAGRALNAAGATPPREPDEVAERRSEPGPGEAQIRLDHVWKTYGPTVANADVSLGVRRGEVLGLVGANGAGKSTLMKILCGVAPPDRGTLSIAGNPVDLASYGPRGAHERGIRIVHQEGSLCANLTVAENFFLEQPGRTPPTPWWLRRHRELYRASIEEVFPDAPIDADSTVESLSLSERQMVEIARAVGDPALRLLILDEPTSSLDAERSRQLRDYVRRRAEGGLSIIFISHKLHEVLDVAERVAAMRNGRLVWTADAAGTTVDELVQAMGGAGTVAGIAQDRREHPRTPGPVRARLDGAIAARLGHPVELRAGEIVGLAGLEGNGQRDLLHALFRSRGGSRDVTVAGRSSFVSGDRQSEGVFPLWTVLANIALGRIATRPPLAVVSDAAEEEAARPWMGRLSLDAARLPSNILDLSGGNQQKALVARALVSDADVILLDDPTRGVDIATKREFYKLASDLADDGRLLVWHSTEDIEFLECDRVLVFQNGAIVRELAGAEISEEAIIQASFGSHQARQERPRGATHVRRSLGPGLLRLVPFVSLALVFGTMSALNPNVASAFGLDLLLGPAVALVLLAAAQMFVVGGSEIDLGIGMFAGFVNVVSATLLVDAPAGGVAALAGGLAGYAAIALLIQRRRIPAIVATLGASFIWAGLGHTLQPTPGGSSPPWLSGLFGWSIPGVPTPLALVLIACVAVMAIDRSPLGTVLRGFGNAPAALQRSGWSPVRYAVYRYLIAGAFGTVAGLWLTASNNASDINAGGTFTLLSIAAVVIGGCQLLGGVIAPAGTVAGAVTLSLIGALLAFLGVSTDFNAAVQGGLLIAILALGAAVTWRSHDA